MSASEKAPKTSAANRQTYPQLGVRHFGRFNTLGLWTLYRKEVQRFLKVWMQTMVAPIITTLLFLAIFSLALAGLRPDINGVPFINFLAPGLMMMAMVQNAFANSSSSLLVAKVQGNVVDFLMPPLSPLELNIGITMGGLTRGLFVGAGTYVGMLFFVDLAIHSFVAMVFYAAIASMLMAQIGLIGGIWAEKFDHLATITNFGITPLAFLSGTFYSVSQLPRFAYEVTQYNPFFYMIDGFRYALTGVAEGSLLFGALYLSALTLIAAIACQFVLARGWRLKA
jgi:ABC-2 type transport system permease protein